MSFILIGKIHAEQIPAVDRAVLRLEALEELGCNIIRYLLILWLGVTVSQAQRHQPAHNRTADVPLARHSAAEHGGDLQ